VTRDARRPSEGEYALGEGAARRGPCARGSAAQRELCPPLARLPWASGERGEADVRRGCAREVLPVADVAHVDDLPPPAPRLEAGAQVRPRTSTRSRSDRIARGRAWSPWSPNRSTSRPASARLRGCYSMFSPVFARSGGWCGLVFGVGMVFVISRSTVQSRAPAPILTITYGDAPAARCSSLVTNWGFATRR
jgi:hypothetical protein